MSTFVRNTLLAALLAAAIPAQAAIQTWNFSGTLDSGHFTGTSVFGMLSFDDATLTGVGSEWIGVDSLVAVFGLLPGLSPITETMADAPPEVGFENGTFLGLSVSFSNVDPQVSFVAGTTNTSDAFLAYDTTKGFSGAGSVIYAPVPEPETWAMVLMGLGLVSLKFRTRNKHLTLSNSGV
jgi:hypothetical protein